MKTTWTWHSVYSSNKIVVSTGNQRYRIVKNIDIGIEASYRQHMRSI